MRVCARVFVAQSTCTTAANDEYIGDVAADAAVCAANDDDDDDDHEAETDDVNAALS